MPTRDKGSSTDPLDVGHAIRRPERTHRYWLFVRVADALAGHRDGRHDGRVAMASNHSGRLAPIDDLDALTTGSLAGWDSLTGSSLPESTLYLQRLLHTFSERDRREFLGIQARVAKAQAALLGHYATAERLAADVNTAHERKAAVPEQPDDATLRSRGAGERFDHGQVVATRRRREHSAKVSALESEVAALRGRLNETLMQIASLEGMLRAAFDTAVARSHRLRAFYERRAAVYRRWHRRAWRWATRRLPERSECALHLATQTIPAPEWTTQACPWVRAADAQQPALAG